MGQDDLLLYAYGLYLLGGGTPEGFGQLNEEDISIIISVHDCLEVRRQAEIAKMINKMFSKDA